MSDGFAIVQQDPVLFWFVAASSVFLLAVAKSGFGGALATTSVPVMLFVLPPTQTLAVLLPVFVISSVGVFFIWYKACNWRLVTIMCLFALAGQIIGWLFFDYFTDDILKLCIGLVAFLTGIGYWIGILRSGRQSQDSGNVERRLWHRAIVWCGVSGISSFVSLSGGIPAQIFLLPHRLPRAAFVGTFSVYFMVIDLLKAPLYAQLDVLSWQSIQISALLMPAVPAGIAAGWWLNKCMDDRVFYHISYAFLVVIGAKLLADVMMPLV